MRTIINHFNNLLFPLIPESKGWGLKRALLRLAGAKVGRQVKISSTLKVYGAGTLEIGDNTWVGYQTLIAASSSVVIGANCDIAPRVYIGTGTHLIDVNADHVAAKDISKDVCIGDGCWLGANSTILPGTEIGCKCVVAAGAVVAKSFTVDKILIAGVPAERKKNL